MDQLHLRASTDWFREEELQRARYAIVGCGAIGNEIGKNLALLGVGRIDLYDLDRIELHNLTRSVLFRESDIGYKKVEVACRSIRELNHNVNVRTHHGDFWDTLPLTRLSDYEVVFSCVDSIESRIQLNWICQMKSTPLVITGIDSRQASIETFPFRTNSDAGCYECTLPPKVYQNIRRRYSCGWLRSVAQAEHRITTTIMTSSIAGAIAVAKGLKLSRSPESSSTRVVVDSLSGVSIVASISQNGECLGVGEHDRDVTHIVTSGDVREFLESARDHGFDDDSIYSLSDPIVISHWCRRCSTEPTTVFGAARSFDSSFETCPSCGADREVNISDRMSGVELGRFPGRRLPVKFLYARVSDASGVSVFEVER